MSLLSRDVSHFRGLSQMERRLLLEAVAWLWLVRMAMLMLPYRHVASLLRLRQSDASEATLALSSNRLGMDGDSIGSRYAEATGWAVRAVAVRTPWLSTCLVQSLAGYAMLRWHGVPSVVYLGVKGAGAWFTAHSWLRCGDRILTGGGGQQRYSVIAAYLPAMGRRG